MSKKFFVLFSLTQTFTPQIYRSKITITKYMDKNSYLKFETFDSDIAAKNFISELKDTIPQSTSEDKAPITKLSSEPVSKKKNKLNMERKKQTKDRERKNKKIKVKSDELFQMDLLAHQKKYGLEQKQTIARLKDYIQNVKLQFEKNFHKHLQKETDESLNNKEVTNENLDANNIPENNQQHKTASEVRRDIIKEQLFIDFQQQTLQEELEISLVQENLEENLEISKEKNIKQKVKDDENKQDFEFQRQPEQIIQPKEQKYLNPELYRKLKETIPLYRASSLQKFLSEIPKNIELETSIFRRQNPGYTVASYTVRDAQSKEILMTRQKFPLGITKAKQGELYGMVCALGDLSISNIDPEIKMRAPEILSQGKTIESFGNSLDYKIRNAASILKGIKSQIKNVHYL